ncbi:TPA: hypothetical protein ACOL2D_004552 [Vibrio parahaemolyticus]
MKKLNDQEIVYGGLPIESLTRSGIDVGNEKTILLKNEIDLSGWDKWRVEQTNKVANMDAASPLDDDVGVSNDDTSVCTRYIRLFLPEHLVKRALKTKDSDSSLAWLLNAVKQAASF